MQDPRFTTSDIHLAAFIELNGLEPTLEKHGQRVVFTFPGSAAFHLANQFNDNTSAPIADFVETLKALRGRMYDAKGGK